MIQTVQVKTDPQLDEFIRLPWKINKHRGDWVPSFLDDDRKLFSPTRNPAFAHCSTLMLLAIKNGETVGRAMGIIHHPYNQLTNQHWARFGFMDAIDDEHVFNALIKRIEEWAFSNNCQKLIGPFGFSDKDPQGFLSFGFDGPTVIVTNCNPPYMVDFATSYGMEKFLDLVEYRVPISKNNIDGLRKFSDRAIQTNQYQVLEFESTKKVKPYIHDVFDLMNRTYMPIFGYSPVTKAEADEFADRFLPLLNPRLIKIITNPQKQVVAFIVGMADIAQGLKKSNGKIWPFGWFHLLRAMKTSKRLVLLLGAVSADKRHKGLDAVLGYHLLRSAQKEGFSETDSHLIMETNHNMRREIERLEGMEQYKRFTIFQKAL